MDKTIEVKKFSTVLRNRNKEQTDGFFTGVEFRKEYLNELNTQSWWDDSMKSITLDFEGVSIVGPSWANEVFAYFTKFENTNEKRILEKIKMKNISDVKLETIKIEIKDGYRGYSW